MKFTLLSLIFTALIYCCLIPTVNSQSWIPVDSDTAYPRTLVRRPQIPALQARLNNAYFAQFYRRAYARAISSPPGGVTLGELRSKADIAYCAAFINYVGMKPLGMSFVALTPAEKTTLVNKANTIISTVPTDPGTAASYDNWQWHSKIIQHCLFSYDLLRGSQIPFSNLVAAHTNLTTYVNNLNTNAATLLFGFSIYKDVVNNHTIMTASAVALGAIVLSEKDAVNPNLKATTWISNALWVVDNVLFRDATVRKSNPNQIAGYSEGPYYLKYGFLNAAPMIWALKNYQPITPTFNVSYNSINRTVPHPYNHPDYNRLYEWAMQLSFPNGKMAPLSDSFVSESFLMLGLLNQVEYHRPLRYGKDPVAALDGVFDLCPHYFSLAPASATSEPVFRPTTLDSLYINWPHAGDVIFRSSQDSSAFYAHFSAANGLARTGSGGHNQGDVTSFVIYKDDEMMALDPGYLSYTMRDTVGGGIKHNLILVNGCSPLNGTVGNPNDNDGFAEDDAQLGGMKYVQIRSNYCGATIRRKVLFLDNQRMILGDICNATADSRFDWQLHGNGKIGRTIAQGLATDLGDNYTFEWQKNTVRLRSWLSSDVSTKSLTTLDFPHEIAYQTIDYHTTQRGTVQGVKNTAFLNVLDVGTSIPSVPQSLSSNNQAIASFSPTQTVYAGSNIANTVSVTNGVNVTRAEAEFGFYEADPIFNHRRLFFSGGDKFWLNGKTEVETNTVSDFMIWRVNNDTSKAYISTGAILKIRSNIPAGDVIGDNVVNFSFQADSQQVIIELNNRGYFDIIWQESSLPGTIAENSQGCAGTNNFILKLTGHRGNVVRWESSTDNWITFNSIANTTANLPVVNLVQTTSYRAVVKNGNAPEVFSAPVTITIYPQTAGGALFGDMTFCSEVNQGLISLSGQVGDIIYWESSIDHWLTQTMIPNTTTTLTYNNITQTTEFRVVVRSGPCNTQFSGTAKITILGEINPGIVSADRSVCSGNNSGVLTLSGHNASVIRWESSIDNWSTINTIANTGANYIFHNLNENTSFRAVVGTENCPTANSTSAKVTILPNAVAGNLTVFPSGNSCNSKTGIIKLSGHSGNVLRWESSTNNFVTVINIPNTTTQLSYTVNGSIQYRAVVHQSPCSPVKTQPVTVSSGIALDLLATRDCYQKGKIVATPLGGIPYYTYVILPNAGRQLTPGVFDNLPSGTYTIIVKDGQNCSGSKKVTIPSQISGPKFTRTEPIGNKIILEWTDLPGFSQADYQVRYRIENGSWIVRNVGQTNTTTIYNLISGNYELQVRGKCRNNNRYTPFSPIVRVSLRTEETSELYPDEAISIYPNPARDRISIKFDTAHNLNGLSTVHIYTLTGAELANYSVAPEMDIFEIETHSNQIPWPGGIYICKVVTSEGRVYYQRVIIER